MENIENCENRRILPLSLVKDKVHYRRKIVCDLCLKGRKQHEIAQRIGCSISTVEKDFKALREEEVIRYQ